MKFEDILKGIKEGKSYRRPRWYSNAKIQLDPRGIYLIDETGDYAGLDIFSIEADDWIDIEENDV